MVKDQHPRHDNDCVEDILSTVRNVLSDLRLAAEDTLVIALSGGPDSLCLADAVITLKDALSITPVVAHLNHGLRGAESEADAEFVANYAASRSINAFIESANVSAMAQQARVSIEVAARNARYRFLRQTANKVGSSRVLIAHNADDQAETILLRIIRGTGITGLRGMQTVSQLESPEGSDTPIWLVRPLLHTSRQDINCYCISQGLQPRHDSSNDNPHHTRNRIRHDVMPLLADINPGIRHVLARLGETAARDQQIIDYATQVAYRDVVQHEAQGSVTINRSAWQQLLTGLQRSVLRYAIQRCKGQLTNLKYRAVEEARDVLNSDARSGEIAILADVRIRVSPASFTLTYQAPIAGSPDNSEDVLI